MSSTKEKLAIITGAARGIGLATAKMFNENGFKVAIVDKDKDEIKKLSILNNNIRTFCYDISNHDSIDKMFKGDGESCQVASRP